eukprot:SAG22_NODE_282_length_13050_cov_37.625125_4_plen_149_part_00
MSSLSGRARQCMQWLLAVAAAKRPLGAGLRWRRRRWRLRRTARSAWSVGGTLYKKELYRVSPCPEGGSAAVKGSDGSPDDPNNSADAPSDPRTVSRMLVIPKKQTGKFRIDYSDPDLYEIKVRDAAENDLYATPGDRPTDVERQDYSY